MSKKKKVTLVVGITVVTLATVAVLSVYSGIYSVAATKQHPEIQSNILSKIMEQSVRNQAQDISVPAGIDLHE